MIERERDGGGNKVANDRIRSYNICVVSLWDFSYPNYNILEKGEGEQKVRTDIAHEREGGGGGGWKYHSI